MLSSDLSGHLQLCYQHQVIGRLLCFLLFFFCLALLLRLLRVSGGEPSRLGFCDTLTSHSSLIHSHQDGRRLLALIYSNNSPSHNCLVASNNASLYYKALRISLRGRLLGYFDYLNHLLSYLQLHLANVNRSLTWPEQDASHEISASAQSASFKGLNCTTTYTYF